MKRTYPILTTAGAILMAFMAGITASQAYVITPAWEMLVTTNADKFAATSNALPILTNTWNATTKLNNRQMGTDIVPLTGGLKRYDANRLLLAITENGIEESADLQTTNPPLYTLSATYPDRSLIWINPTNGVPMGLALTVGLYPLGQGNAALEPWYTNYIIKNCTNNNQFNNSPNGPSLPMTNTAYLYNNYMFDFGVSDDGYIYTGWRNKILRYAPNGSGGFVTTPEVILSMGTSTNSIGETNGPSTVPPATLPDAEKHRWFDQDGMFGMIHVKGAGTNTVICGGGRGAYVHHWWRVTTWIDSEGRTNWFPIYREQGGSSHWSMDITPPAGMTLTTNKPGELWHYSQTFPATDNGASSGTRLKYCYAPYGCGYPTTNLVPATNQINWTLDSHGNAGLITINNTRTPYYRGSMIGAAQACDGVPFWVACEVPSWNSINRFGTDGFPQCFKTGWLGLHHLMTGERLGCVEQQTTELDIMLIDDLGQRAANWWATYADLDLRPTGGVDQPDGTYEILWGSFCYGYGRYIVKKDDINITKIEYGNAVATNWFTAGATSTNNAYVLQRTMDLVNPIWEDIVMNTNWPGPYDVPGTGLVDGTTPDAGGFYRVKLVVP